MMPKHGKRKQERRPDVPHSDHIARHCNPQRVIRNPITRAVEGVFPEAFALRDKETYLSTHWMESFSQEIDTQFCEVLKALRNKLVVRDNAAIARLNVGAVIGAAQKCGHSIRIRDRSSQTDPGYAGIYGTPRDNSDAQLLGMLVNECCVCVRGVKEIDAIQGGVSELPPTSSK